MLAVRKKNCEGSESVPSTVKRAIDDLTLHGYIKIEQRFRKSGANSSLMFTVPDFSKYRTPKG